MEKGIYSGIVISDIRNFTGTFGHFQKMKNGDFIQKFIVDFYDYQVKIAEYISDDFWYNNLGDSMIFIFLGENYAKDAYAFSILCHKILTKLCSDFNDIYDTDISFGIGVDSGEVWKMIIHGVVDHTTYLGNAINIVKRIETQTKTFAETELIVGGNIYDELMSDLYPEKYSNARLFETNYSEILKNKPSLVLMSDKILLYYIFKLKLVGIETPLPLFRYENDLANEKDGFWNVVEKLIGPDKKNKISISPIGIG